MPLPLLLLLTLLGPGSGLQLRETWENGSMEATGPLLVLSQRQVTTQEYEESDDYDTTDATDPPEMLENSTGTVSPTHKILAVITLGQTDSAGPGTSEPATLEAATEDSVGLDAEAIATGDLSTKLATREISVAPGHLVSAIPPLTETPSIELPVIEALSTGPAATEALTTQPAATEALSTGPAATEALTTQPAATEALSMGPAAMEALTTQPAATEALSMGPAVTETQFIERATIKALSTELVATAAPSTEPTTTEALSTDPATKKASSTGPATRRDLTKTLLVSSDPHRGTTVAVSSSSDGTTKPWTNRQSPSLPSSVAFRPTVAWDYIPVKQCLLAILILALVATIFLVCTVVLAVRLSRKNHMYPVRNYSPTEMVCISSLLPEGGEGPAPTANGGLPTAKGQGRKAGPGEDRDGDDLTLHSFLS